MQGHVLQMKSITRKQSILVLYQYINSDEVVLALNHPQVWKYNLWRK